MTALTRVGAAAVGVLATVSLAAACDGTSDDQETLATTTSLAPVTTAPATSATPTSEPTPELVVCRFDPTTGAANPLGPRAALWFQDLVDGRGAAIVSESFGTATGDGAAAAQRVIADLDAVTVFERFVSGDTTLADGVISDVDPALLTDIAASYTCEPDETAPRFTGYEQALPGTVVRTCAHDPALGPSPLGMRSAITFDELAQADASPITVAVYEHFGNAIGDGARWYQSVFVGVGVDDAFDTFVSDPSYFTAATGDDDAAEVELVLAEMRETFVCRPAA